MAAGFKGPIYYSQSFAVFLPEIFEDALKIGFTKDKELIFKVLTYLKSIIKPIEYKQWIELYQSSFSIGPAQELFYEIEDILHDEQQKKPNKPAESEIVVDSSLAAKFTQYYSRLIELWDK